MHIRMHRTFHVLADCKFPDAIHESLTLGLFLGISILHFYGELSPGQIGQNVMGYIAFNDKVTYISSSLEFFFLYYAYL